MRVWAPALRWNLYLRRDCGITFDVKERSAGAHTRISKHRFLRFHLWPLYSAARLLQDLPVFWNLRGV